MLKVMQRLRGKGREGGASSAALSDPEAAAVFPQPSAPPADGAVPGFVPEPSAVPAAVGPVVTDEVADWHMPKLSQALVTIRDRYSAVCEQYRSLRARLLSMNAQQNHQLIAITSSLPQEGKSVTAVNLGVVMAEPGEHRVLIADADFRRTSIARMLGLEPRPGLAELIRGTARPAEVLRPTHLPNLKVITAGVPGSKEYNELVGTPAARMMLAELRQHFDYTFLDMPPVNTVSDVSMLAPHCDGVLLVIEMQRTPEPTVREAVRTLQTTNVKILGCVLSRYRDRRRHYYERCYSYYYNRD